MTLPRAPLAVVSSLLLCCTSLAETKVGFRQLGTIKPVVVQRGKESPIDIRSSFTLDNAHSVFFDRPGIKTTFKEEKPKKAPRRGRASVGTPFRFHVDVPADQPTGVYEVRVATNQAVSSVSHLLVTDLPVTKELDSENGTPAAAQEVPMPTAVAGTCEKTADVDCFKFKGKKGQTITLRLYAQCIAKAVHLMGSGNQIYTMDGVLALYGPDGRAIARNQNYYGGDPFISCTLPADGEYVAEVSDARYIGNGKYVYALEISDRPVLEAVIPLGVQKGKSVDARPVGHSLGDTKTVKLAATDKTPTGWQPMAMKTARGASNHLPIRVSDHPERTATGKNTSAKSAQKIEFPCGVTGQVAEPLQAHYYSFDAKKGEYVSFELSAMELGLPFDGTMEVQDPKGKILVRADDGYQTKDAKLYFRAPADGTYLLKVRDLHDRGGKRFIYHVTAEPSGPDFEISGLYYYGMLSPGTQTAWFVNVRRLNGFTGPVTIEVDGLPKGVTMEPLTIPSTATRGAVNLQAAKDAPINASLVTLSGVATVDGPDGKKRELRRRGRVICELQTQGGGQVSQPIATQIVGVTEPLDLIEIEATPSELNLKPGDKAEITIRVKRKEGSTETVNVGMSHDYINRTLYDQLPPGVTVNKSSTRRLSSKESEGKIILDIAKTAKPIEKFPLAAIAQVSITFSINTTYASKPIYLTIAPPEEKAKK
ncbi:hypothetical protein Pan216_45090 [Planctomycetes bacterium Pan216]|uniref:Peptidase C-terminal archaeal/bacterial domain-containing protein n=1 Tax=Kolteria novifilia TaxID=2527975 RepID=A0A518B9F9_9BACT|nr:hypothetical protein Pan216_45090 [Planctomycetes bacterium Pan216]